MPYFDNAATTLQKPQEVFCAVQKAMRTMSGIGRGGYHQAATAAEAVYECRELAGEMFGAEPEQVVFTMNATHALNMAIRTLVKPGGRTVISGFEHNAVLRPIAALHAEMVVAGTQLYDSEALLEDFNKAIQPGTDAVVCTQVSNVFGWRLPVEKIGLICQSRGVPFIVDCAQSAGAIPVTLASTRADFLAMPGHKGLYGPQGTGLLICGRKPQPLIYGGTGSMSLLPEMPEEMPDHVEAGTHNVPGICGLAAGLRFVNTKSPASIAKHEKALAKHFVDALRRNPNYRVFFGENQTGTVSVQHTQLDCEEVAMFLAQRDIAVRAGLHCAPLAHKSAGTVQKGTLRVSFSAFNTIQEVEFLLKNLCRL